ncbi:TetR family transcriptional regulator [Streptomyces megasporus]|uniref:TetR family transcriptional regulator n=1 Tax=Streptomyces megasporus TaxID=44060 RepID=UPI0004E13637|nr:TetR family transcriptional regulator [Streptomyces megasporus]
MTARPDSPSSAPPLTERQEARRRRILDATVELARRGGFGAVQMREVADSADVALGTLYRYFPSKIHLLVAVLRDRLEGLRETLHERPPGGREPGARVVEALTRAFRALREEPRLTEAMVRAFTFADRSAGAEVEAVSRLTTAIVLDAVGRQGPPPPELLSVVRVVEHTWHSALIGWLSGRCSGEQVYGDIKTVCELIPAETPGGAHR